MAMFVRRFVCGMVMLALAACSPQSSQPGRQTTAAVAASQPKEIEQVRPVVVMLGDSLTAGYGLATEEALPDQIEAALKSRGVSATFVNAGVSGDTTRGGLERYDFSVKGSKADILILALGANDFLGGLSAEQARDNLAAIIDRAKADGLRVALVGVGLRTPGRARDPREDAFAEVYVSLAKQYGLKLYPDMLSAVSGQPALLQSDGLHPTAEGVRAMASAMADFAAGEVTAWKAEHPQP